MTIGWLQQTGNVTRSTPFGWVQEQVWLEAGGAFTILSVDGDNAVYHGQTGVIILPDTGVTFGASGNLVAIAQGSLWVWQTVTAESTSSITITVALTGFTLPGSATLYVHKPKGG